MTNEISESKKQNFDDIDISLEWNSTSSLMLDLSSYNCGKCSFCGQWTTDREKTNAIEGICNGSTIDGRLFCDECLPNNHRWAL
ncbi:hypothetical protein GOQ27_01220 [Clostridium sp. D2Q-11]|uniref:Uncharacterized protein n=1 Tax=Anaeromonas frigoriresistens TaxID=2683708 RepID=A0A942UV91_9FIRM|nr:hypothetical protein [Anaeromonas frigoriresistens]MBS4537061.1 hypothetical protein [Anaeromonas frigoriresistens]